jgi:hypothetical protein
MPEGVLLAADGSKAYVPTGSGRDALVKGGNFYVLGVGSWTTSTLGFRPAH